MKSITNKPFGGVGRIRRTGMILVILAAGLAVVACFGFASSRANSRRVPYRPQEPEASGMFAPNACTITVNSTMQEVTVAAPQGVRNGACTLGEAILAANGNPNITECPCAGGGPTTIQLQAGMTYTLTAAATTLYGPTGLPAVSSTIIIEGNGATIARSGAGGTPNFRLFSVAGTVDGVQARETNPALTSAPGTLLNGGNLTLRNVTLSNGSARLGAAEAAAAVAAAVAAAWAGRCSTPEP